MSMRNYIDLETIPDQRPDAFERYLDQVKPPGNIKKQESIDKWLLENAESKAEEEYRKTGLTGLHGEICSIAFAIENREILSVTRGKNVADEVELITWFWSMLYDEIRTEAKKSEDARWPRLEWVGHNLIDFDLRFLKQRSIVNGIEPSINIPADARHGTGHVFDTMKEWAGWRGYVKQDELVEALGIESPDWAMDLDDIDGSKVWDIYREGDFQLIADYNKLDVWKVREIHRRMTYV